MYNLLLKTILWISVFFCVSHCIAQVQPLKELYPGPESSLDFKTTIISANGKLFFTGNDYISGKEPFVYDPQSDKYTLLMDINTGNSSSGIFSSKLFNDFIIFPAKDSKEDYELYATNTKLNSVILLKNINANSSGISDYYSSISTPLGLFFTADDGKNGEELWITDGTSINTMLLKDIEVGKMSSFPELYSYNPILKKVLFAATTQSKGREYYISDGTPLGTYLLKDINPGDFIGDTRSACSVDSLFYFIAEDDKDGKQIWKSDGTQSGTTQVTNNSSQFNNPFSLIPFGNKCLFFANGQQFYITDGSLTGTILLSNSLIPYPPGFINFNTQSWVNLNNKIYFAADQTSTGENMELFVTDGTKDGTKLLKEIFPGGNAYVTNLFKFNNKIYFSGYGAHKEREELWSSDGSNENTKLLADINPGNEPSYPNNFVILDSCLYFTADVYLKGNELFRFCEPITTSVNEKFNTSSKRATIYPNPTSNNLYILTNNEILKIRLFNYLGVQVSSHEGNIKQLNFDNLNKGIYYLVISYKDKSNEIEKLILNK
ncbi:MAG: T9SS type A sorting domain-containing protein [Saprospiraceae bacterium]|nr:T9SS type A sorting domain-containing protein [Candidatus Defluviibacterium haderslevense]